MNEEIEIMSIAFPEERDYPKYKWTSTIMKEMDFWDQCLLILAESLEAANDTNSDDTINK